MLEFSSSVAAKGLPTEVKSQNDVDTLIAAFEKDVKALNLWQYYVLSPKDEKTAVQSAVSAGKITPWKGIEASGKSIVEVAKIAKSSGIVQGLGQLGARLGVYVDGGIAAGLAQAAFPNIASNVDALAEKWSEVIDVINVPLYREWEEDTKIALDSMKNRLKYIRLDEHGPRLGAISATLVLEISLNNPMLNCHLKQPACGAILHAPFKDRAREVLGREQWLDLERRSPPELCASPFQGLPPSRGYRLG